MSVLVIVFVGWCEVFVCLDFVHCFPLGHEAHRSTNGVSVLSKMSIFPHRSFRASCPLSSVGDSDKWRM